MDEKNRNFRPISLLQNTHTDDLLANHIKHKVEKYRDGMLRGVRSQRTLTTPLLKKLKKIKIYKLSQIDVNWTLFRDKGNRSRPPMS